MSDARAPECDRSPQLANQKFNNTCGLDLVKLHAMASPNIAMLKTGKLDGGTAFKVCNAKDECAWITADHVVGGKVGGAQLITNDGKPHDFQIIGGNPKNDIRVLQVKGDEKPTAERPGLTLLPDLQLMHKGDPIVAMGHGEMFNNLMLSPGQVIDPKFQTPVENRRGTEEPVFGRDKMWCVRADTQSAGGQSGGPALTADGHVAGLVSAGEPGNMCYASGSEIGRAMEAALHPPVKQPKR